MITTDPWEMLNVQDAEIDKLRVELNTMTEAFQRQRQITDERDAEIMALRKQILLAQMAVDGEGPRTCYEGSDDEAGVHGCCGEVSYKPHGPGCWWLELKAALAAGRGELCHT